MQRVDVKDKACRAHLLSAARLAALLLFIQQLLCFLLRLLLPDRLAAVS